jgi:Mrp family chromosome partitioning ATPase
LTARAVPQYNPKRPTLLVDQIVERVLTKLKDLSRVPRDVTLNHSRRPAAWTLGHTIKPIVGREAEIQAVLGSLQQHNAAVIWGGPGEGKTTIAMEAAARLRVEEPYLSAFELDMRGKRPASMCSHLPCQEKDLYASIAYMHGCM